MKYKGREYTVEPRLAGTSNHGGVVVFEGIVLANWWSSDSDGSLEGALERAHKRLEAIASA